MAFSNDKGRHRRGRWWRRGSYLFSRRTEAPDADRSFWTSPRDRRSGRKGAGARDLPGGEEPMDRDRRLSGREEPGGRARRGLLSGYGSRSEYGARDQDRPEPGRRESQAESRSAARGQNRHRWEGGERRWEQGERLSAAVVERPRYTWQDFELDDSLPRAQPNRPDVPPQGDGLRHCGKLETILHRQWDARRGRPPVDVVRAVESLARLPDRIKEQLAAGLEGIYVGPGGVPDLDDMGYLRGAPLPSGRASWDICAGAYGDRKIVVGDRPSPTPDVMMHEVGHAIDDIDAAFGVWVSDTPEFVALFEELTPLLASSFHRQGGGLGRKEFFADAFAAIASRQRPALVDMLGGNTRMALDVMLFFNRRYGI
ncbi:hypothetical protein [Nonomuraea sp. LPB2021202275-12-8]|uniref:hypothetical protein n=1 Tax=Nonomuraea sp. LPB2021202275-12-8 TaxID=3120159 RepID=UPI00300D1D50